MKSKFIFFTAILIVFIIAGTGCTKKNKLHNGYYMAEIESFDKYGWKEFVSIYVSNNNIINVEYNAKNKSGFIKSWDMDYMREMNLASNNYPNKYTRNYINELLTTKNPEVIDAMAGATESYHTFKALSAAAIKQARKGDKNVILIKVEIPD